MATEALFSILTLPQSYEADTLTFNVVFLPRNISPLDDLTAYTFPLVGPFAEAGAGLNLAFKYIPDLDFLPEDGNAAIPISIANLAVPGTAIPIYEYFKKAFNITDVPTPQQKAPAPVGTRFIKKYLPLSYRNAFAFTNPRVEEAVVDDSYHCAFKEKGINNSFQTSSNQISWGKVYGYCLRNPELAKKAGLIYAELTVNLPSNVFENGGWVYVDFDNTGYFSAEVQTDQDLAKRFAARIPPMAPGTTRSLFAPILFPVTYGIALPGIYDEQQREAADYDDGFAKILHGFQPINTSLLTEETTEDSLPPVKDIGIRLSWDDEQVLIWLNRQMRTDPQSAEIFPMGVINYRLDVREVAEPGDPDNPWTSLNLVKAKGALELGEVLIMDDNQEVELGTDVYPNQIDGDTGRNYWLPLYFTQWAGKSLAIPDKEAQEIYRLSEEIRTIDSAGDGVIEVGGAGEPLDTQPGDKFEAVSPFPLIYGEQYEFRVRMGDISGGGPTATDDRLHEAISQNDVIAFKRYVAPHAVRMRHMPDDNDPETPDVYENDSLELRRPLLEYPNVVFTNKYPDPVQLIKDYSFWMVTNFADYTAWQATRKAAGIAESLGYALPDPDVNEVEIIVEVKSLQMDNALSVNRRDNYIKLYAVTRPLTALDLNETVEIADPENTLDPFERIEEPTTIALEYRDANVLNFGDPADFGDLNTTQAILDDPTTPLILPTARDIRMTIRPLGQQDDVYFGNQAWRKGKTIQFMLRRASDDETNLFDPTFLTDWLEGVYLQPDTEKREKSQTPTQVIMGGGTTDVKPPTMIQRLAHSLDLSNKKISLIGENGKRLQVGCSREIRHSLSPDGTSLTFSTKVDMLNHWLVTLNFRLARDWTWNPMQLEAFVIDRRWKFGSDADWGNRESVGKIELHRGINLQALQKPDRSFTQLVFVDAVEPKPDPANTEFPDIIEVEYFVQPQFKADEVPAEQDAELTLDVTLPVTTIPAQIPKLASAGMALSPYKRDERYANTEPRERHLWIELEEAIEDPNDALFIRFLAYSPDPLLVEGNRLESLMEAPEEPVLPIDPELIRVIRPNQADDGAGLQAMVEMTPATTIPGEKPIHFLVPIPPGLHREADELFGFFTYELRVGHRHIWSTSQGRFGRPLRVTGVQHPAPSLFCVTSRDSKFITVSAPYATAVHEGKNITANPPNTEIWCLLYAQVKRADNQDYRNILLGERKLGIRRQRITIDLVGGYMQQLMLSNLDKRLFGTTVFAQQEVVFALQRLGLPTDLPLSVLCVELLPTRPYLDFPERPSVDVSSPNVSSGANVDTDTVFVATASVNVGLGAQLGIQPLSTHLGHYRILRTSPLTEVSQIC